MHLEVDPTVLSETAGDLRRCVGVAREFSDHRGRLREMVESCGGQHLHEAADHFIGRWGYGMGLLVGDAEHLAGVAAALALHIPVMPARAWVHGGDEHKFRREGHGAGGP